MAARCALPIAVTLVTLTSASARAEDSWWGADKALHFGATASIAGGGYALGALAWDGYAPRIALGTGLGLGAGIGKEVLDAAGLGDPSWKDLTWDLIGTAVGVGISVSIDLAIRGPSPAAAHR